MEHAVQKNCFFSGFPQLPILAVDGFSASNDDEAAVQHAPRFALRATDVINEMVSLDDVNYVLGRLKRERMAKEPWGTFVRRMVSSVLSQELLGYD